MKVLWFIQRADEEAARLYEEFVESFKAEEGPGGKKFVRGGIINPDDHDTAAPSARGSSNDKAKSEGMIHMPQNYVL